MSTGLEPGGGVPPGETPPGEAATFGLSHHEPPPGNAITVVAVTLCVLVVVMVLAFVIGRVFTIW